MTTNQKAQEQADRAAEFARRVARTGLSITSFQRKSGLTRNVIYNLSKGQQCSSPEQELILNDAFRRLTN